MHNAFYTWLQVDMASNPEKATVDYIRAFLPGAGPNGNIEYSYSVTKDASPGLRSGKTEAATHLGIGSARISGPKDPYRLS